MSNSVGGSFESRQPVIDERRSGELIVENASSLTGVDRVLDLVGD
jgi:hypothetical protein